MKPPNPNRVILSMDSQTLNKAGTCKKKYWYSAVEHLKPRSKKKAYELGSFIHDMLYRMNRLSLRSRDGKVPFGYNVTDAVLMKIGIKRISVATKLKFFSTDSKENQELSMFHMTKLLEYLSQDKKNQTWMKPMGAEVGFTKVLYEDNTVCFIYEGRIDFIARIEPAGYNSWVDYKSQSREYAIYPNNNQFIGYSWVLNTNMGFIYYYGLQKTSEKEKAFRIEPLSFPQPLIEQWKKDTIKTFRDIVARLPFGEEAFERNRSACASGGFGGVCQYAKICDNAYAPKEVLEGIKRTFYKIEEWHPWRVKEDLD
jgi:hypothetical protein